MLGHRSNDGFPGALLWFKTISRCGICRSGLRCGYCSAYYEALLATFSIRSGTFYMVIFDPLVYPMDTAWLDGKVPADHYRHSRPGYYPGAGTAPISSSFQVSRRRAPKNTADSVEVLNSP